MAMLTKIKLLLLPSFFLLMAADCGHDRCYPTLITKSRSLGTNDVFSITPLKKVYKVGDTVRIKMVVNEMVGLVDSVGNFTGKKVSLYDIGVRDLFFFSSSPPSRKSPPPWDAGNFFLYHKKIKTHIAHGYYSDKKQFIYDYDAVITKSGKYHLKQGQITIIRTLGDVVECVREYNHIHTLNFKDMKFEVVE